MDDYAKIAALTAMASGDAEGALDAASRMQAADRQAGNADRVVQAPGQIGSPISDAAAMRAEMERLGFVWLDEPSTDRQTLLTQYVRLQMPEGWSLRRSDDSRLRYLVDERGVRRVSLYDVHQFWDPYAVTNLISVAGDIVTRLVYGDETADDLGWPVLTEDERTETLQRLREQVAKGEESPKIYADTAAKAAAWLERLVPEA